MALVDRPPMPEYDQIGNPIDIPDEINRIVVIGSYIAEVIEALGLANNIIAADTGSFNVVELPEAELVLNVDAINTFEIYNLNPDIVFALSCIITDNNPLAELINTDVTVVFLTQEFSHSLIEDDIFFLANILDEWTNGFLFAQEFFFKFDDMLTLSFDETVSILGIPPLERLRLLYFPENFEDFVERPTVFFEHWGLSPIPMSTGSGLMFSVFINYSAGNNIFYEKFGMFEITDEIEQMIFEADPDIIITNATWTDDPVNELKSRPGWESLSAVQNGRVYFTTAFAQNYPIFDIFRFLEISRIINQDAFEGITMRIDYER